MKRLAVISLFLSLLVAVPLSAQTVMPSPYQTVLDTSGNPVAGARITFYQAGTLVVATTYSDAALTVPNPSPVVADAAGRYTAFLASGQSYKIQTATAAGVVLKTVDGVLAQPSAAGNLDVSGVAGVALSAGDVVYLSDGSGGLTAGKWYKADADNTYSSTTSMVGVVPAAIAMDASGTVRIAGKVTDLPVMVVGTRYYVSGTAGGMTDTAPANVRLLGQADTTTSIVLHIDTASPTVPISALTGAWTSVAFAAGNFTASGAMTWTLAAGDQTTFAYVLIGKTMVVSFTLLTTTVAGAVDKTLQITIPAAKTAAKSVYSPCYALDNNVRTTCYAGVTAGGTVIAVSRSDYANWTAAADTTNVYGQLVFEIQ